ncbi:hypothetical protein ABW19_dt0207683 [Dactylella cylindrospora]|nr:hypothetical protein ABW19_dt0207683 [Dactylella cylindrospora]
MALYPTPDCSGSPSVMINFLDYVGGQMADLSGVGLDMEVGSWRVLRQGTDVVPRPPSRLVIPGYIHDVTDGTFNYHRDGIGAWPWLVEAATARILPEAEKQVVILGKLVRKAYEQRKLQEVEALRSRQNEVVEEDIPLAESSIDKAEEPSKDTTSAAPVTQQLNSNMMIPPVGSDLDQPQIKTTQKSTNAEYNSNFPPLPNFNEGNLEQAFLNMLGAAPVGSNVQQNGNQGTKSNGDNNGDNGENALRTSEKGGEGRRMLLRV